MEETNRVKKAELKEILYSFHKEGEQLNSCWQRLFDVANRLSDDSSNPKTSQVLQESPPCLPGIVGEFVILQSSFSGLINKISNEIAKIEKFI